MLSYTPVFDWESLPVGSLVVDVGGGVGAQSLALSKTCPNLRFIVQDREANMEPAKKVNTVLYVEYPLGRVQHLF